MLNKASLLQENQRLKDEIERLQALIDSRPAINYELLESYVKWSDYVYFSNLLYGPDETEQ